MTTLTEQMEAISYKLLTGQITQEEALQQQRTLLGQPVPTPATEEATAPALSVETKADQAITRYQAKKADIAAQLAETKEKAAAIQLDKDRIAGAINAAESKSRIISGSGGVYRAEKAEMIAKGLLGEKVDLSTIKTEAEDFADNVSASDLALGIKALRGQLAEIERRRVGLEADRRRLTHEYCEAHAYEHSIQFCLLASRLTEEYCRVQAAHRASQSAGNTFSTLAPENFSGLHLFNPLSYEMQRETGCTTREWSGVVIEQTAIIRNAMAELAVEMGV